MTEAKTNDLKILEAENSENKGQEKGKMKWVFNCFSFGAHRRKVSNATPVSNKAFVDAEDATNHPGKLTHSSTASTELTSVVSLSDGSGLDRKSSTVNAPDNNNTMPERGQWAGKLDFMFGCISYAVGLGNVWRFPYLCYENGGGAFLIPFVISIFICGIPLFVLEVALGQYLSTGGIGIWDLVPILKGIGYASMTMIGLCNLYYIILIAWTFFYFFSSFQAVLPWEQCGNWWNTDLCLNPYDANKTSLLEEFAARNVSYNDTNSPVKEYWERRVLDVSTGLDVTGKIRWELCLYLLLAWLLVYVVIWRGIHQSGKIIWFTAISPYVILLILFIRGVTLEGASDGLMLFISPKWEKLKEPGVWVSAGTQVLFSYGVGIGANIALGSYNKYRHNFYKDSIIVCFISSGTSIFAGLVIFSVLGHMAFVQGKDVATVAKSGPGLAFLAYPEVVTRLPVSPLWAVLFFLMLITLGVDSQFCTVEAFVTGVVDEFAIHLRPHRKKFTAIVVCIQFLLGIPMVTQGGIYLFQIMDHYSASGITLLTVVFFEIIGFCYCYGARRIYSNIEEMIGFKPNYFFFFCWVCGAPCVIISIFLFSVIKYEPLTYADYVFPWWGEFLGWGISMASISWIPCYAIYYLAVTPGTIMERLSRGFTSVASPVHSMDRSISPEDSKLVTLNTMDSFVQQ